MCEAFFDISEQLGEILFFVVGGLVLCMQDQYINHIINETGVNVILRGRGSGNTENSHVEGTTFMQYD